MRLKDHVAIVTGAARGLGKAFSVAMAKEGAKIMATDLIPLGDVVGEIQALGGEVKALKADVTVEAETQKLAEETFKTFGRIDILVNCAAIYYGLVRKPFFEIDPKEWDKLMAVNVKGTWLSIRAVFPYMKQQGKGKIINLSKGAIVGLTRALAVELGPHNININALAPGFTDTEASRTIADVAKYDVSRTPIKRLEQPNDLFGALIFFASDESDFITGQTLLVDGGRAMH